MQTCKSSIMVLALVLGLGACVTTQTTSGKDYVARYSESQRQSILAGKGANPTLDRQVMDIAQVEPDLHFPARIGIARLWHGRLTSVPAAELQDWQDLGDTMGSETGTFVPVSPLIAEMVRPLPGAGSTAEGAIADIRRGAARQHLDYVLVYEVLNQHASHANLLSVADVSLLGLFVLPSRNVKVESTANAIFLDVRNGYPYGTATGFATKAGIARAAYQYNRNDPREDAAAHAAVKDLTTKVREMLQKLAFAQTKPQVIEPEKHPKPVKRS